MVVFNWIMTNILQQTFLFMGLIAGAGLIAQGKKASEIIEGVLMTMVGYVLFGAGNGTLCGAILAVNEILTPTVATGVGVYPFGDNTMSFSMSLDYVGGNIMQIFIIAWAIHILLVKVLNKYFKCVFLTVHMMLNMVSCNMLFWYGYLGWTGAKCYIPSIIVSTLYWCISPMLVYDSAMEMSGNAMSLGHLQQFGAWIGGAISGLVGNPDESADALELPGWLQMFSSSILNLSVTMPITFIVIGILALVVGNPVALEALANGSGSTNWVIWMILQGITFTAGVATLQYGLRIFLGALVPAFQGFSEKILPGCTPAIDCVAFFSYSPLGVIFSFLAYALAGILVSIGCGVLKTPIFILPSILLAFFDGGSIGVFANHKGGWKGTLVAGFITGAIMHIGAGLLSTIQSPEAAANGFAWGNFDTNFYCLIIFFIVAKILGK